MYDFNFSIPTEIYFGKDCWRQAGSLMKKHAERILMVYGSDRIFCDGPGEDIVGSLKEAGCTGEGNRRYRKIDTVEFSSSELFLFW